jgi:hypothetical protein
VLVVTSDSGTVVHLSLHPDIDAAAQVCAEVDESALTGPPAAWTIATRIVGEGSIRETASGAWTARHQLGQARELVVDTANAKRRPPWWRLFRR